VLYQSVEGSEALTQDEDSAATIAIYLLTNAKGADDIRLLGCIQGDGDQGSIHHCVFHPACPLLAFHYRSKSGPSQIILWYFGEDIGSSSSSFVLLNHSSLQLKEGSTPSIATITGRLKYIQFSACGTQIIYQVHGSSNPHIRPILGLHVYNMAMQQQAEIRKTDNQPAASCTKSDTQSQDLTKANILPQSLSLNQPVLHGNGVSTRLSFNPGATNRDIKIVHRSHGVEAEQSLLSLPAWKDVKNISVSVRMPSKTREDKVTIILNKTAQPYYSIGHNGEHAPPAVVRKDIRAIAKPKIKSTSSLSKVESGWRGIGCYGKDDENERGHVRKRARIINPVQADYGEEKSGVVVDEEKLFLDTDEEDWGAEVGH
jgi:hypothetical protein